MTSEHDDLGQGPEAVKTELADALTRERPVPAPGFRGALGRYLTLRDPGYGPRPERLRMIVTAWVFAGVVLIAIGLMQASGSL